jgi:hypothetical protein
MISIREFDFSNDTLMSENNYLFKNQILLKSINPQDKVINPEESNAAKDLTLTKILKYMTPIGK